MTDVDGVQHANHVSTTKVKQLVLKTVDGAPTITVATDVHPIQIKLHAKEPLVDVFGFPMPAYLVAASLVKQLAYLHCVVGVLGCASIAEVSVTHLHVQGPSIAFGILILREGYYFMVQAVLILAQEHLITSIVQHAVL